MPHTKGPWKVERRQSNGCEVCPEIYTDGKRRMWIATASGAPHLGFDDTLPNAHLIAAAPDLLAACEAAQAFGSQGDTHEGNSVSEMLRAAIQKAKGE